MPWTLVYAGTEALSSIPEDARQAMQAEIDNALKAGKTVWLSGTAPDAAIPTAEFLVGPGIPVYFKRDR